MKTETPQINRKKLLKSSSFLLLCLAVVQLFSGPFHEIIHTIEAAHHEHHHDHDNHHYEHDHHQTHYAHDFMEDSESVAPYHEHHEHPLVALSNDQFYRTKKAYTQYTPLLSSVIPCRTKSCMEIEARALASHEQSSFQFIHPKQSRAPPFHNC